MVDEQEVEAYLEGESDELNTAQEQETEEETVEGIVDLIERSFESQDDQGAFAEVIQGLAFDEGDMATEFIAQMQDGETMKEMAMVAGENAEVSDELMEQIEDAEPGGVQ